ncbi:hypothetical protein [Paenibacillus wynnii]|uniref:hypothetical protein n=1 Tax=Paenibacillus wynnii TaxID=268407 RepID=UPI00196A1672|nr:hypothetical protein [Paenibacillus wynnii]
MELEKRQRSPLWLDFNRMAVQIRKSNHNSDRKSKHSSQSRPVNGPAIPHQLPAHPTNTN